MLTDIAAYGIANYNRLKEKFANRLADINAMA